MYCFTETWLTDSISDFEILPTKFSIFRKDRSSRGGGVLIAVDASLPCSIISSPSTLEVITVSIGIHLPVILCTVYVPPNSTDDYQVSLLNYLTELSSSSAHVIIVGDFNLPDINWSSLTGMSSSSKLFCEFVFDNNLIQHVDSPTHVKGNILDIVLSNTSTVSDISVDSSNQLLISDHFIITFKIEFSLTLKHYHEVLYVFDYKNADMDNLLSYLFDCDFSDCLQSNDIEYVWATIKSHIYAAMTLCIPKKKIRRANQPCWFTSDIIHHTNCVRTLRRKAKAHPTEHNASKLKSSELNLKEKALLAKTQFETKLIHECANTNSSRIYKYISKINGHNTIPPTMSLESHTANSNFEKVSLFNTYFHSVFTESSFLVPPQLFLPDLILSDIAFSESDVFTALQSLDPSKAMGIDGIGPRVLKHCAPALYEPIFDLFLKCLSQCYIPQEWRVHKITPIYKSGDRTLIKNYRPISLLCTISKVLERIIHNNIINFVTNSISPAQFGFLRKHSTLQQMLIFINELFNSYSQNTPTDVIYLDFKKAFDSVAHNELLVKLWKFGITGNMWEWFKTYLHNRTQCVSLNNCTSYTLPVISGVPQGSILGPILFLIFVNDLPSSVSSSLLYMFADDTKCVKHIMDLEDSRALQQDLNLLTSWSHDWNLLFNATKCVNLRFSSGLSPGYPYCVSGQTIALKQCHRDLGIIMTWDLSWKNHHEYILSKAYKIFGLRRTFSNVGCTLAKKTLYLSLVRSQLMYCSQIWRPQYLKGIQSLENVQRRATKFITNDYTSCYKNRLINLHLSPLMMQLELNDILFLVVSIKNPTKSFNILDYVTFCSGSTRSSATLKLVHSFSRNNRVKHFYFNRLPRLWNSLPTIDIHQPISTIKHKLQLLFWNHFITHFSPNNPCSFHFICPCAKCSVLPIKYNFNHSVL